MADTLSKRPRPIAAVLFVLGVLTTEAVLFASEQFQWFAFNREKGITVLVTVAIAGTAIAAFLVCVGIGRLVGLRLRFGLATVFFLVVLAALRCAWLGSEFQQARKQAHTVELVLDEGGTVQYVAHGRTVYLSRNAVSGEVGKNDTLESIFGNDFFYNVTEVALETANLVDQLHHFRHLKAVNMCPATTDSDVEKLLDVQDLELIDLSGTQITDNSMGHLVAMPRLRAIYLGETRITDLGLKELQQIEYVSLISVEDTNVTKAGVDAIRAKFPDALIYSSD